MIRKFLSTILVLLFLLQPSLSFALDEEAIENRLTEGTEKADPCGWGFPHKEGVVLVLCGGGMKGRAHVGVLEVLERENIPIAAIVGTSMGSIIGGLYACGYTTTELKAIMNNIDFMAVLSGRNSVKEEASEPGRLPRQVSHPFSWGFDLSKEKKATNLGLLNDRDIYLLLENLVAGRAKNNFNHLKYPFAAVATNLLTGETTAFRQGSLSSSLRASMALPVVYAPWEIDGQLYIDGGLKANLPVLQAKELFPDHPILAINLANTKNREFEDIKNNIDVAMASIEILMDIKQQENIKAADLVITPDLHGVSTMSDRPAEEIFGYGKAAAEENLDKIKLLASGLAKHATPKEEVIARMSQHRRKIVREVHFSGANESVEYYLTSHYKKMIDKPLEMNAITQAISDLTSKFNIKSAHIIVRDLEGDDVALDFKLVLPAPYEFYVDGFASNTYIHRWLSLGLTRHNLFYPDDKLNLETRMGTEWGVFLDYDTSMGFENSNWSWALSAQEENYDLRNELPGVSISNIEYGFKRYNARLMNQFQFSKHLALALGYQAQALSTNHGYEEKLEERGLSTYEQEHGPVLSLTYNHVDDVALPTSGVKLSSLAWYGLKERTLLSRTAMNVYIPAFKWGQIVLNAGLKTGDITQPAFAALLGADNELYSLGKTPVLAGEAYWVHFGVARQFLKTWWGGIEAEAFVNYGAALNNWSKFFGQWETGLSFSIPFMALRNKFYVVYDQDGGFTFGYTIGTPRFRHGF